MEMIWDYFQWNFIYGKVYSGWFRMDNRKQSTIMFLDKRESSVNLETAVCSISTCPSATSNDTRAVETIYSSIER